VYFYLLLAFVAGLIVSHKLTQLIDRLPERLLEKMGEPVELNDLPAHERRELRRLLLGTRPKNVVSIKNYQRGPELARAW
jgi:hypothetical protein